MPGELPYTTAVVLSGLEPTAPLPDRIAALNLTGLSCEAIAYGVGVSCTTVNKWECERTTPSAANSRHLDDIRFAALLLIKFGGLEPPEAGLWLARESGGSVEYPILNAIRENPSKTLKKLQHVIVKHS
ncbi:MAG TPA: hypothetical protein VHB72_04800 [Candidatus Saccharimonadales bacterium]|nr:hypothetical protein [Candidatus Saccharimonadales bacterium]